MESVLGSGAIVDVCRSRAKLTAMTAKEQQSGVLKFVVLIVCALLLQAAVPALGQNVVTYHNDNSRSGTNATEQLLRLENVKVNTFGKLFAYNVDGYVVAQPLYMQNLSIPGKGLHDVVFVATQHDSLYAFDADNPGSGTPLWQVSFANPSAGVTSVPIAENGCSTVTGFTEVGIMGTPVIDPKTATLYVDVKTKEVSGSVTNYFHRLHALDLATGAEKFGGPVVISASVLGPNGEVDFNALTQNQRPGLLLSNGTLYIAFGSNGCDLNAVGWLLAYSASSLQQVGVFNTSPGQSWGANIWESGDGPAADSDGNVYISTANGTFDVNTGGSDFAESIIKLSLGSGGLQWTDYFTPFDQATLTANGQDLGGGGVLLLPHQGGGSNPDLLVAAGKGGTIYLINRDNMGQYNPTDNSQIVQSLPGALKTFESAPLLWNSKVYFFAIGDVVKAFGLSSGLLTTTPILQSRSFSAAGVPAISSNGSTKNGMFWVVRTPAVPVLSAMNATNLSETYNSGQNPNHDSLGAVPHFVTPMVTNGRVYVGTKNQLAVYGLYGTLTVTGGNNQTGAVASVLPVTLSVQASSPYSTGQISGITISFSDGGAGGTFSNPNAVTDSTGTATTTYTLPTKAKTLTINATSNDFVSTSFTETAVAGPIASLSLFSGGGQTGTVGTPLPSSVTVAVLDAFGNGVVGAQVTYSDGGVGGTFSPNPVTTNLQGNAPTTYTLPTKSQIVTITATSGSANLSFNETAAAGAAATMSVVSGGGQTGTVGTQLPAAIVVGVRDSFGNNVIGTPVTFGDGGAGGTFSGNPVNTNNNGQASVNYTLPATPQTVNMTATAGSANVGFSEKAVSGSAGSIGIASGAGQTGTVGAPLANPVIASVKDTGGNPVPGVAVTFSDGGAGGSFSANPVTTNSLGQASVTYTLPTKAQTISNMTASTGALSVQFSEKAVAGPAAAMAVVSGGGQTGTVGTTLPAAIVVSVKDSFGNAVSGASVTYSDGGAGGTYSTNPVTTNSVGQASTNYTLPTKAQTISMTASTGSVSVSFSEKAVAGPAASIAVVSGGGQTGTVGAALPAAIVIGVKDALGNGVPGASVTFSDTGAGGTYSTNPVTTNSQGQASTNYTLPTAPKTINMTATSGNLNVPFSEKAVAGSPASMVIASGNQQSAGTNTPLPSALVVGVKDQFGNPVSGAVVTFTDNGAGGTFSSTTATTGTNGNASVTYTTGSTPGNITITASVSGANSVNFAENVI